MRFLCLVALLLASLPRDLSDLLREPELSVVRNGDAWLVQKAVSGSEQPLVISRHQDRSGAELRRKSLPRLRLSGEYVRFDPFTRRRTPVADWSGESDAIAVEADVRAILERFAPPGIRTASQSIPVYMARLYGATGFTSEEYGDHSRLVVYVDPFRATGRLHAASTIVHEMTHAARYRARGFHGNRAASVMSKEDFVLLGLTDEYAAYQAEANLIRSVAGSLQTDADRNALRDALRERELRWPEALRVMVGYDDRGGNERDREMEVRRQVVLDLAENAARYWESHHRDLLHASLRETIQEWREHSREWKAIQTDRSKWKQVQ